MKFWPLKTGFCLIELDYKTGLTVLLNPFALRKAKIVYNFGLSEFNRVNVNFSFLFYSKIEGIINIVQCISSFFLHGICSCGYCRRIF